MNVFILAAGLGTRLRPLTLKYPKPCVPFLNVPMGLYPFRFINEQLTSHVVANCHYLPQQVQQLYKKQKLLKKEILISDESSAILGSAGGLKRAETLFSSDETILMINADEIFFDFPPDFVEKAYLQHIKNQNFATLIVTQHPEVGKRFGAIWCDQNKVRDIGKTASQGKLQPWHYVGLIFLNRRILQTIPENIESNIFYDILINQLSTQQIEIFPLPCRWYETGTATDYLAATQDALQHLNSETLSFIHSYDPSTVMSNVNGLSLVSNSLSLDKNRLRGFNVISQSSSVASQQALIENSILFENEILNLNYFS